MRATPRQMAAATLAVVTFLAGAAPATTSAAQGRNPTAAQQTEPAPPEVETTAIETTAVEPTAVEPTQTEAAPIEPTAVEPTAVEPTASPLQPTAWSHLNPAANPEIVGWPNALRISGADDYSASLAVALMLRGSGVFPYGSPDPDQRSSAPANSDVRTRQLSGGELLAVSDNWWGTDVCPRSVIIVAGDLPADALAATPLSDPTGFSTEPLLVRTASASPFIAPIGENSRVDTDNAPILVTASARAGATGLSSAVALAAADLRSGACTEASAAIIIGGAAAVGPLAERELLDAGYSEVFRVAGSDRYATAATIATALGTQPLPQTGSSDDREVSACHLANQRATQQQAASQPWVSTTGHFYANSAIEWHRSAEACEVLARTVVIADGLAGVDALAAGPFISYWQVPVLLHDGSPSVRDDTLDALDALNPFHVLVLGGPNRIGEDVLNNIAAATDAEVIRLAGADRYETAIEIAKHLGGWWPSNNVETEQGGLAYSNSVVCVTASTSEHAAAVPDHWQSALVAAPFCGSTFAGALRAATPPSQQQSAVSAVANQRPATPPRALTPTGGAVDGANVALLSGAETRAQPVTPLLLTDTSAELHPALADFLAQLFASSGIRCHSTTTAPGCATPSFAYVFGSAGAVSDAAVTQLSAALMGEQSRPVAQPRSAAPFVTALDMTPVFAQPEAGPLGWSEAHLGAPSPAACWARDGYADARWLTAVTAPADDDGAARHTALDLVRQRSNVTNGGAACVGLDGAFDRETDARRSPRAFTVDTRAVSSAGRASPTQTQHWSPEGMAMSKTLTLTAQPAPPTPEDDSTSEPPATSSLLFGGAVRAAPTAFPQDSSGLLDAALGPASVRTPLSLDTLITLDDIWSVVAATAVEVTLGVDTFEATFVLHTARGDITGVATGAARLVGGTWHLRGASEVTRSTFAPERGQPQLTRGGFAAELRLGDARATDDVLTWRFDAQSQPQ